MKRFIAGFALSTLALTANAYVINFTGHVNSTDGSLSGVSIGSIIQGHFLAEEPTNTYARFNWTHRANYRFATGNISANVEGHAISAGSPSITLYDNLNSNVEDGFSMSSGYPLIIDGVTYTNGAFGFNLTTKPGNTGVINGLNLPSLIDASAFDEHSSLTYGYLQRNGAPGGSVLGFRVSSVTVNPVPEPSSPWLIIAAGLALAALRHKKASSTIKRVD
ncbi:MAG: hypothetical protein B7Y41_09070 [Hydrogenophilales bacterium 28-61-23]|nr:MAG: hypothetical protein B7Y41_09070 [Hydrogenophilales bacterium 28-61-23]